jgi:hypothetical protein
MTMYQYVLCMNIYETHWFPSTRHARVVKREHNLCVQYVEYVGAATKEKCMYSLQVTSHVPSNVGDGGYGRR